jgi:hypothetical protein
MSKLRFVLPLVALGFVMGFVYVLVRHYEMARIAEDNRVSAVESERLAQEEYQRAKKLREAAKP